MIYDFGKKVEATAIINRPEINSSTKDEWWSEQVYFHRKNAVSSLATDCILPRWPPAENEQVRTSSTSIEKGHAHTHTKQNYSRFGSAWCIYHQTTSKLLSTEQNAKAQKRCACFIFCTPFHALCQWHLTHVSCKCLSGSRARLFGLPQTGAQNRASMSSVKIEYTINILLFISVSRICTPFNN